MTKLPVKIVMQSESTTIVARGDLIQLGMDDDRVICPDMFIRQGLSDPDVVELETESHFVYRFHLSGGRGQLTLTPINAETETPLREPMAFDTAVSMEDHVLDFATPALPEPDEVG